MILVTLVRAFGGKLESAPLPCEGGEGPRSQGGTGVLVPPQGLGEQG